MKEVPNNIYSSLSPLQILPKLTIIDNLSRGMGHEEEEKAEEKEEEKVE